MRFRMASLWHAFSSVCKGRGIWGAWEMMAQELRTFLPASLLGSEQKGRGWLLRLQRRSVGECSTHGKRSVALKYKGMEPAQVFQSAWISLPLLCWSAQPWQNRDASWLRAHP